MQRKAPAERVKYYTWNNEIQRLSYGIAGGRLAYDALSRAQRLDVRAAAKQLHELGKDIPTAHVAEKTDRRGFVYVITHPSWPGYCKVGRAFDPESRLRSYQTGCPARAYKLEYAVYFPDCHSAEKLIHDTLADYQAEGEWYRILPSTASHVLDQTGGYL